MFSCPIQACLRKFEDQATLTEHLRRRHAQTYAKLGQRSQPVPNEAHRLPKIGTAKPDHTAQQQPVKNLDFYRRSASKGTAKGSQLLSAGGSLLAVHAVHEPTLGIGSISATNQTALGDTMRSSGSIKRPSLQKKYSLRDVALPALPNQVRKTKLETLRPISNKSVKLNSLTIDAMSTEQSNQPQQCGLVDRMRMTVSGFNQQQRMNSIRSRSKDKPKTANNSSENKQTLHVVKGVPSGLQSLSLSTSTVFEVQQSPKQPTIQSSSSTTNIATSRSIGEPTRPSTGPKQPHTLRPDRQLTKRPIVPVNTSNVVGAKAQDSQAFSLQLSELSGSSVCILNKLPSVSLYLPNECTIQFLSANGCGLRQVTLNSCQTLQQLSLLRNQITSLSFLNYVGNTSLRTVHVDHNAIVELTSLPPNILAFTASFNSIKGIQLTSKTLIRCRKLKQIDLSFNPIRKESNYKQQLLISCNTLKKIDGMAITKMDVQLAYHFKREADAARNLITESRFMAGYDEMNKTGFTDKSVTTAHTRQQTANKSSDQEPRVKPQQCKELRRIIKTTSDHLTIIKDENVVLKAEFQELTRQLPKAIAGSSQTATELQQLKKQCEALELLNVMQWADEDQLDQLLRKEPIVV